MNSKESRQLQPGNIVQFNLEHYKGMIVIIGRDEETEELHTKYLKYAVAPNTRFADALQVFTMEMESDMFDTARRVA